MTLVVNVNAPTHDAQSNFNFLQRKEWGDRVFRTINLQTSNKMSERAESQVLRGLRRFTNIFYHELSKKEGNVFFSPLSLHAALAMELQGAQGSTADALAFALDIYDAETVADGYQQIMMHLNDAVGVTIKLANKIFMTKGVQLRKEYQETVKGAFFSEVEFLEFSQKQLAAKTVNDWVALKTNNKIPKVIGPDDFDNLSRSLLVNAIYFNGRWEDRFVHYYTTREPFHLNEENNVQVDMMHKTSYFKYQKSNELDAQILAMPYRNRDFNMAIILPNKITGMKDLEKKLFNKDLKVILEDSRNAFVNIALPKFKLTNTIDLKEVLTELGLGIIFDPHKANFKGMLQPETPEELLFVDRAFQMAFINVDENGTEAAAATVNLRGGGCPELEGDFIADHPFIFILWDEKKAIPLFFGRVSQF